MNYHIITGSSKGLGRSIAQQLLRDKINYVIGISRTQSIQDKNYRHVKLDLSDITELKQAFDNIFPHFDKPGKISLINNAGSIGQVTYIGNMEAGKIEEAISLNITAPALLMNEFVKRYKKESCSRLVINISSGAGKKPVDGWFTYCGSKAALDMFTAVAAQEARIGQYGIKFFSVAPGIIDTDMQAELRNAQPGNFSRLEEFIGYKKEHMLESPDKVAEKYLYLIEHEEEYKGVVMSVRDL